jgi:hypothetical protein
MSEHAQLRQVCQWNRTLARENARLRDELRNIEQECRALTDANANLGVQLEACDQMLGAAMNQLLEGSKRP